MGGANGRLLSQSSPPNNVVSEFWIKDENPHVGGYVGEVGGVSDKDYHSLTAKQ
jgi:hypothetical protein